ncbi:MAG TPA: hypothetical protein VGH82_05105 [Gaiellaceae bacterium]
MRALAAPAAVAAIVVPARKLRFFGFEFDRRGRYVYVSSGAGAAVRGTFRVS